MKNQSTKVQYQIKTPDEQLITTQLSTTTDVKVMSAPPYSDTCDGEINHETTGPIECDTLQSKVIFFTKMS